jgi:quinol monooxygenase YgiN
MKVSSRKRKEMSQAIISLLITIRSKKGCVHCDLFHGVEDENVLCLLQKWDSMKNFETYRESESHKVLRGAMHLLDEPWEIISCQEFETH